MVGPEVRPRLCLDDRFLDQSAAHGGRLLDVAATERLWGEEPGRLPEDWLESEDAGTIGFCPTNWGWQFGAWLVEEGRLRGVHGDVRPTQPLWMLAWTPGRGWHETHMDPSASSKAPAIGLEMPQILHAGEATTLPELLGHERLLADLRNVFDFAAGRGTELSPEFWSAVRHFLPGTSSEACILLEGGEVAVEVDVTAPVNVQRMAAIAAARLPGVRVLETRVVFGGSLPRVRLPLFALGAQAGGSLVVVAIDGRQPGLPGGSIEDAAALLAEHGAITGGLGSAGGDVCLVERTATNTRYLNRPSTGGMLTNQGVSRRVPALMLI